MNKNLKYLEIKECKYFDDIILEILNNILRKNECELYNTDFFFNLLTKGTESLLFYELGIIYQLVYIVITINFTLPCMIKNVELINIKSPFYKKYNLADVHLIILILTSKIVTKYNQIIQDEKKIKHIPIIQLVNSNINNLNFKNLDEESLVNLYYDNIKYLIRNIVEIENTLSDNDYSETLIYKDFINISK